jgi:protein-S-isoprenylcysteine O-methyltransferase Ste14
MLIGIDIYYYKDLFLGRPICGIIKKGPYKYLSNPMYGIGQFNGYGTALMSCSLAGIFAMSMNQTMMFIFFHKVEKPQIIKFLKDN